MFFQAEDGFHYPISDIEKWKSVYDAGRQAATVYLRSGERLSVSPNFLQAITYAGRDVTPAQPDTYYLGIMDDGSGKGIYVKPVIGWLIQTDTHPIPVTSSGCEDGVTNDYAVMMPNGSIDQPDVDTWPSLRAFLDDLKFSGEEAIEALEAARVAMRTPVKE